MGACKSKLGVGGDDVSAPPQGSAPPSAPQQRAQPQAQPRTAPTTQQTPPPPPPPQQKGAIIEAQTIASTVNIRKGSLKVTSADTPGRYNVVGIIDASADDVTLCTYIACMETSGPHGVAFRPQEGVSMEEFSQVVPCKVPRGDGYEFRSSVVVPRHSVVSDESRGLYPIVFSLQTGGGAEQKITYISIERTGAMPQAKRCVLLSKGQMFLLKQVFGGNEEEDGGCDCTVCLSVPINTVIMPCRHKALCEECASSLMSAGNSKCPICRTDVQYYIKDGTATQGEQEGV